MFRSSLTLLFTLLFSLASADPHDVEILRQFRNGLDNPELLPWPDSGDDPCGWKYIFCDNKNRVNQIQAKGLNLSGPLPQNLNQLTNLFNVGLQNNRLNGPLPSFRGLSNLKYLYLDNNNFDSIPSDFFDGLQSLEVLALDNNNLNASSGGWHLPQTLQGSTQLTNLSCMGCNLTGPLPEFLGKMNSLSFLKLSSNNLTGEIPLSLNGSALQVLWLNNQQGERLTGRIDVVASMVSLTSLWLHGNSFTGTIPDNIGDMSSLRELNLNGNNLVGLVPQGLGDLKLDKLDLNNNHFMGPIPNFKAAQVSYNNNDFCVNKSGVPCAFEVMALLGFLGGLNYPENLVDSWSGNDPCGGQWLGIKCNVDGKVNMINLPNMNLSGSLSPSVANLGSLVEIRLGGNDISGAVPGNWSSLTSLTLLDLSGNNISPPLPLFKTGLKPILTGNPLFNGGAENPSSGSKNPSSGSGNVDPASGQSNSSSSDSRETKKSKRKGLVSIVAPIAGVAAAAFLLIPLYAYCFKRRKDGFQAPTSLVIHPRDPSDSDSVVKIAVANNTNGSISNLTGSGSGSRNSSGIGESHVIDAGNLRISVQVLRNVTKNFAPENELGRGGFGVVYKGELDDGTKIAVKRMEAGVISSKALDEFQAEIAVLSKVRHRHLVSLLGYSIEGNERILVYEYMPQGALSKHLFHWKSFELEPLSWKRRLNIALDVARGMEYLHTLAHQSFIHRDLKPSNILLADDFRAKVSDFGLVKLAPEGEKSVVTRLAGTFGYLAPEYAVTGKITTKADVFSFGVVLMELLTGLMALDEDRPEESQYLAAWFWHIKSDKKKLMAAIDKALDVKEETFESISIIAELAGHCTAREPSQRPEMGHAVNVLAPLVEKWKPFDDDTEEYSGIDYSLPLNQMVKGWQEAEGKDMSYMDLEDSKSSIPARPTGFADSFTSADGR
ncbi:receptor protein kinase TMK1-like [Vigna unguiculata]|uniref:non-specific serine/threonine protein kinase n=1 Tax=Vigna unguiculata TaxID=3917 RepID=A0A4D6M9X0_VIGUN|nr:receptor protein kinase TMK1-like [Vigna unguiculata]QCD98115.1 transmembrane receptor protein serine/threonine kinase [Vigna unguiculata]